MNVDEGQSIKAGQSLAEINVDTSSVAAQGAASIVASLSAMKGSISESFDTQIDVINSQIQAAQIELDAAETNLDDTKAIQEKQTLAGESSLVVAQQALAAAEVEKEQSLNVLDTKEKNLYTNAKNALTGLMIIDTNTASFIDEVFEITPENADKNDKYEYFL